MLQWSEIYHRRLDWARAAHHRFVAGIEDPTVRAIYERQQSVGQSVVVTYGPSQTGKTELILRLMHLLPEAEVRVRRVLRGGRPKGLSSSSTATVFQRSQNNRWQLSVGDTAFEDLSDEDALKRIGLIRDAVEHGRQGTERLVIDLPRDTLPEQAQDLAIVDLPGPDSSTKAEVAHVSTLINVFLPVANLVLLVQRADNLTSLQELCEPLSSDWAQEPERFRVVLTRTYSLESTKQKMRRPEFDLMALKRHVRQEANRNLEPPIPDALQVYPIEYGESWKTLSDKHPDVWRKANSWVKELTTELVSNVSTNEYDAFKRQASLVRRIEANLDSQRQRHDKRINDLRVNLATKHKRLEGVDASLTSRVAALETLTALEVQVLSEISDDQLELQPLVVPNEMNRRASDLARHINTVEEHAIAAADKAQEAHKKRFSTIADDFSEQQQAFYHVQTAPTKTALMTAFDAQVDSLRTRLTEKDDSPWPWVRKYSKNKWGAVIMEAEGGIQAGLTAVTQMVHAHIDGVQQAMLSDLHALQVERRAALGRDQNSKQETEHDITNARAELELAAAKRAAFDDARSQTLAHCRRYATFLEEEFHGRQEALYARINAPEVRADERLWALLELGLLVTTLKRLEAIT
jgi:hypothetical protein